MEKIIRGEVWLANLNPTQGREQSGIRPVLIFSVDIFNNGSAELVIILPITSQNKHIPIHVVLETSESGLKTLSYVKVEDIRSISRERLIKRIGAVSPQKIQEVGQKISILLGI